MIVSSGRKKSRSKIFKIKAIVLKKKILAHFFPYYPLRPTSSKLLWGSTTYFRNCYANYKTLSLTIKRLLKTQIYEEKFKLSNAKNVLAFFSRTIEHDKRQETTYKGPQGSLLFTLEVIGSFFRFNRLIWTQLFEKERQSFQWRKDFGLFFWKYRVWQTSGDKLKGSKRRSDKYCGSYKIISAKPERLLKTQFLKKRQNFQ